MQSPGYPFGWWLPRLSLSNGLKIHPFKQVADLKLSPFPNYEKFIFSCLLRQFNQ